MKKFFVLVEDKAFYTVEAETEEEAIDSAWQWFSERVPSFEVTEAE